MEDGKSELDVDDRIEKEKVVASFTWLLNKAFTGNIPKLYSHILLEDFSGGWYVHPQLMRALISCELYSTACANLFETEPLWSDHASVLANLRALGFPAIDPITGQSVDSASLTLDAPFYTDRHMATIHSIMVAHMEMIITPDRVDKALKNFCGSSILIREREGERFCETAAITWLQIAVACSLKQQTIYDSSHWLETQMVDCDSEDEDEFMASISVANQIALLLNLYSPDLAPLDDFELDFSPDSGHLPESSSIHNAFVARDFCNKQLPSPTPWTLPWPTKDTKADAYEEGMHFLTSLPPYPPDSMAVNLCCLLADLFYWLEIRQSFRPSYKLYRTYDNKASNGVPAGVNFKIAKKLNTAGSLGMSSRSTGARSTYRLPKSVRPALHIDDINNSFTAHESGRFNQADSFRSGNSSRVPPMSRSSRSPASDDRKSIQATYSRNELDRMRQDFQLQNAEPLMPAKIRPLKEISTAEISKKEELSDSRPSKTFKQLATSSNNRNQSLSKEKPTQQPLSGNLSLKQQFEERKKNKEQYESFKKPSEKETAFDNQSNKTSWSKQQRRGSENTSNPSTMRQSTSLDIPDFSELRLQLDRKKQKIQEDARKKEEQLVKKRNDLAQQVLLTALNKKKSDVDSETERIPDEQKVSSRSRKSSKKHTRKKDKRKSESESEEDEDDELDDDADETVRADIPGESHLSKTNGKFSVMETAGYDPINQNYVPRNSSMNDLLSDPTQTFKILPKTDDAPSLPAQWAQPPHQAGYAVHPSHPHYAMGFYPPPHPPAWGMYPYPYPPAAATETGAVIYPQGAPFPPGQYPPPLQMTPFQAPTGSPNPSVKTTTESQIVNSDTQTADDLNYEERKASPDLPITDDQPPQDEYSSSQRIDRSEPSGQPASAFFVTLDEPIEVVEDNMEQSIEEEMESNVQETADSSPVKQGDQFFVTFDDKPATVKPPPRLSSQSRKQIDENKVTKSKHPAPSKSSASSPKKDAKQSSKVEEVKQAEITGDNSQEEEIFEEPPSPSLSFVIGDDDDMQKENLRRQHVEELQKRRERDREQKMRQMERDTDKKRDAERMKQIEKEEKKALEKQKKEAIFQAYLQKKQSDNQEDNSPAPSVRRRPPPSITGGSNTTPRGKTANRKSTLFGNSFSSSDLNATTDNNIGQSKGLSPMLHRRSRANFALDIKTETKFRAKTTSRDSRFRQSVLLDNHSHEGSTPDISHSSNTSNNHSEPRLFVQPKSKSNRSVISNAIKHCCLAGTVNQPVKDAALKELDSADGSHFMILMRGACQYRSIYNFNLENEQLIKVSGTGPKKITHDMVQTFYKYSSSSKKFTEIPTTKHLSPVVDAIAIYPNRWRTGSAASAHASAAPVNQ